MIIDLGEDFNTCRLLWKEANIIYRAEKDDHWLIYFSLNHDEIICRVKKSDNTDTNMIFIDRWFKTGNMFKVSDIRESVEEPVDEFNYEDEGEE